MTNYVVGFLFDEKSDDVVLIRKKRPSWQAGKLNGVGGHVEPGELPLDAIIREFKEETGILIEDWTYFANLSGYNSTDVWDVNFYWSVCDRCGKNFQLTQMTDEFVNWVDLKTILYNRKCIPNLRWLVPMALNNINGIDNCINFNIEEAKYK